ncbi:MAG: HAD family hydrolase [Thermoanaerobaculales bacterium]|jgi:phosphoglycolate phosphatase|nr:HAD family hydrolase [Thermoanaerobaculales bacterium]
MRDTTHRLVTFDLDGTLVDSLGDLADSMNAVLARLGHPSHPRAAYRRFVGDGIVMLAERALPAGARRDERIAECVTAMRAEYATRQTATTRPFQGIPEVLSELRSRKVLTAVLSNKPDGPSREIVDALLGFHPFDIVRGARPDVPLKPDPTAALEIAARLGVEAQEAVFVGDTNIDMRTGRAAGMTAVGVTWGFRDEHDLISGGAHQVIHHPAELLALV